MSELHMEADGLPPMTPAQRAAFARLTHATAHETIVLRTLRQRMDRAGVKTMEQVHALIAEMLTERFCRLGGRPDEIGDAQEAAANDMKMDLALAGGAYGHA